MINNIVVDRIRRGVMLHSSTRDVMWSVNQITNPSLSVTSEESTAVDALGTPIARFNRGKEASFSAENSLFDLSLLAAQSGTSVEESSTSKTFRSPYFDEPKCATAGSVTLRFTPATGTLKFIYKLNGDGTLGTKYTVGSSATGKNVTLSTNVVTFAAAEASVGDVFYCFYEFEANGTNVVNKVSSSANDFPAAGRFIMEVLGIDPCDPSTTIAAYLEFPNAKLASEFDITFGTEATHPFSLTAMQDYCSQDKVLFHMYIPDEGIVA